MRPRSSHHHQITPSGGVEQTADRAYRKRNRARPGVCRFMVSLEHFLIIAASWTRRISSARAQAVSERSSRSSPELPFVAPIPFQTQLSRPKRPIRSDVVYRGKNNVPSLLLLVVNPSVVGEGVCCRFVVVRLIAATYVCDGKPCVGLPCKSEVTAGLCDLAYAQSLGLG